jgi:hypothetical protein
MILSRQTSTLATETATVANGGIVQCTGSIFEGESGQKYARLVEGLVGGAARGVGECDEGVSLCRIEISFTFLFGHIYRRF